MAHGIRVFSEIGKLNKVPLHRHSSELEALTPATLERLLFDDIPYLRVAQLEHDYFAQVLQENDVEVIYYVDEIAKTAEEENQRRLLAEEFIRLSQINSPAMREVIAAYLQSLSNRQMAEKLIAGIRYDEVADFLSGSLMDVVNLEYPFVTDPMPNLYFTRDPGACVGTGISIHRMHTFVRQREALLLRHIFLYNPDFSTDSKKIWTDLGDAYSVEGGDILVIDRNIVAIGLSQRTTAAGVENFARKLLQNSDFKKVLVFDIPKLRAFMHLDTVFTMVDYDKFTVHPEIEGPLSLYEMTLDKNGELHINALKDRLDKLLALEMRLPAVQLIRCGGGDLMAAQREQWNDGANTLCIAPGRVITYERNYVTNELLVRNGLDVITIPSSELSRGRGGPRCMSCPINRKDMA